MGQVMTDVGIRLWANVADLKKNLDYAKNVVYGFQKQTQKAGEAISSSFGSAVSSLTGSLSGLTDGMSDMLATGVSAFKGLIAGVKGFAGAFTATGIGAIIIGVSAALAGLVAYFKRSGEGADKLDKILGFLKAGFDAIMGVLMKVGEFLVKMFEDPQEGVKELWRVIKENLVTRFEGVVKVFSGGWEIIKNGAMGVAYAIKGIFSEDARAESKEYFKKMADGLKEVGEGFVELTTGIKVEKIKEFAQGIKKAADEGAVLADRVNAYEDAMRDANKQNAIAQNEMARIQEELYSVAGRDEEAKQKRVELTTKLIELQNGVTKRNVALAKENAAIIQEKLRLGKLTNDEAKDELNNAEIAVLNAESAGILANKRFLRMRANNEEEEKAIELTQEQIKALQEAADKAYLLTKSIEGEQEALKTLFDKGEIGATEYQDKLKGLNEKYVIEGSEAWLKKQEEARQKDLAATERALNDKLKYEAQTIEERKVIYDQMLAAQLMSRQEYDRVIKQMDEEEKARKMSNITQGLEFASSALSALSTFQEAAMNRELAAAGNNEAKKDEIRMKYAKKQKKVAIIDAIIGTALAVVNALQTKPFIPMGLIAAGLAGVAGAAQIALIKSQPLAKGGLAYGETLATVGEYPGARTNPEVIAPLDKLKQIIGKSPLEGIREWKFVIEQNQLVAILDNYNKKNIYF